MTLKKTTYFKKKITKPKKAKRSFCSVEVRPKWVDKVSIKKYRLSLRILGYSEMKLKFQKIARLVLELRRIKRRNSQDSKKETRKVNQSPKPLCQIWTQEIQETTGKSLWVSALQNLKTFITQNFKWTPKVTNIVRLPKTPIV